VQIMTDALGAPRAVLLLGGTSDIGLAIVRRYADAPGLRVVLAGRPSERLDAAAADLRVRGVAVETIAFDAIEVESHQQVIDAAFAGGDIDVAIVAFGLLGDPERAWQDASRAVELAQVNYVAAVSVGVRLGSAMRRQGRGSIVALSSVAGERVRRSNFVYGSTKAGMDGFYLGLAEAVADDGLHVLVVRPGFVRTKMTAGRGSVPLAVDADHVAAAVVTAVAERKTLIWVPTAFRPLMAMVRHVPRRLLRHLPL
jgi:decaprenylphospho-beta-D-erythro-pentofuranosid-2-ulose 2-reductase